MTSGRSPDPAQRGNAEDPERSIARLKTSSCILESLLESSPGPIFSVDTAYRYTSFNTSHAQVMTALYGVDIEVGESILGYQTVEEDRLAAQANLDRALHGERLVEDAFSGEEARTRRYFQVTHDPIRSDGDIVGVAVQALDVTELKRAEEDLHESADQHRALFENMAQGVVYQDAEGRITAANSSAERIIGLSLEQMQGLTSMDPRWRATREDGSSLPGEEHPLSIALRTGREVRDVVTGIFNPRTDEQRWVKVSAAPQLRPGETKPYRVFATFDDITELKRVEHERLLLSDAVEASLNEIYIFSVDTLRFRFVNYGARHNLGFTAAQLHGMTPLDLKPEFTREAFADVIAPLISHERQRQVFHTIHQRADGTRYPVEVHLQLFDREPDAVFLAVIQDITERERTEGEIAQARRLLEEAQSISKLGGWQYDVAGNQVTWTDEVYRIHGLGPDFDPNDVSRDITFYAPESAPIIAEAFRQAVSSGEPYDLEIELDRADGVRIWVRTIGRPVTEDGVVVRVTGNIMDITERKRAEADLHQTNERLSLACLAGGVGIWELDVVNDALIWDAQMFHLYGISPGHFDGTSAAWRAGVHPDDLARSEAELEMALCGEEEFDTEFRVVWPDGTIHMIRALARVHRDAEGRPTKLIGTNWDITEFKLAEDEVRRLNEQLERRVLQRTAQLDAANEELEAFAYSVSHDLRAPLRHIGGFAGVLAEVAGDSLSEDGRHCVDTISASVREMGVLIDDLLQFSRTGRAELQITDVDMEQALSEALLPLQAETEERTIEWSIGRLPHVVGDHALLRQVWANLLDNAVKYTRDRVPARIEVGARAGDPGEAVFFVRDDGVGFDMKYADKLFGVFQRLHDSAEFEGTGIGLANVQRVITKLGGRVWAEAELDKGATFSFSLPRRNEAV